MHRSLTDCLSLQNWICPRACIQLLQGKAASAEGAEFNSFLAIVS
jgi:D-alanyl-D-alanine carboxypeptidase